MKLLLSITLIFFCVKIQGQKLDKQVLKAVQIVYNQYKLFFDSSLLPKHVVLDKTKSYLVNSRTQKIKTLGIADDGFAFDEFSLSFAIVYKNDTIRHLPPCRLDTNGTLLALGTPANPVQHGDLLPPYLQLVKGHIKFDYRKLRMLLQNMHVETTAVNLQKATAKENTKKNNKEYRWLVTTACPKVTCKDVLVSAVDGKILSE